MSMMSKAANAVYSFTPKNELRVENATIIWRNFSGATNAFNSNKRTFALVLTPEIGETLRQQGWNVKVRDPRDPDGDPLIYTEIVVNMDSPYPPDVWLFSEFDGKKSATQLSVETIGTLDKIELANVDLIINPYQHNRPGTYKVKGYAVQVLATQAVANDFMGKYASYFEHA